jgi:hypothetical protein
MSKRSLLVITTVSAAAVCGFFIWSGRKLPVLPAPAGPAPAPAPPTRTYADPVDVFQKAFWKRPAEADKILHAERREWADGDGIKKWEWFLAVEPSLALMKHLKEDNAFSLAPSPTIAAAAHSPPWFRYQPEDFETLGSTQRGMALMFGKSKNMLYATSSGGGFQAGAPERAPVVPAGSKPGRLPGTAPPAPLKP